MDFMAGTAAACLLAGCAASGVLAASLLAPGRRTEKPEAKEAPARAAEPESPEGAGTPGGFVQDVLEAERLRMECELELRSLALDARAMKLDLREAVLQACEEIAAAPQAVPAPPAEQDAAEPAALSAERLAGLGLPAPLLGGDVPETPAVPNRGFLSDEEYDALTPSQKRQLALDRWPRAARPTPAATGLDYERWIAWLYEREGWIVRMAGALDGRADMGRDLLAWRKGMPVHVVQCKRWRTGPVREDAVMQLHGSCEAWSREKPEHGPALGVLVCTCGISAEALRTAQTLGIAACPGVPMGWPPAVKCFRLDGAGFYLLPWDDGYDALRDFSRAGTVEEAEAGGCRHAGK